MRHKNIITQLVVCIVMFSVLATLVGICTYRGIDSFKFKALFGPYVDIYARGIYALSSTQSALQARAQDCITLFLGIPLLIFSLLKARKNLVVGRILLAATLGYFCLTYTTYTFNTIYNRLFLVYVILMSTSTFAFALSLLSFNYKKASVYFRKRTPVVPIGCYLMLTSVVIAALWLNQILPSALRNYIPQWVEHGATLPIQAIDLGFVLPATFITGVLVIKRRSLGYILAPIATFILTFSLTTLLTKQVVLTLAGNALSIPIIILCT